MGVVHYYTQWFRAQEWCLIGDATVPTARAWRLTPNSARPDLLVQRAPVVVVRTALTADVHATCSREMCATKAIGSKVRCGSLSEACT